MLISAYTFVRNAIKLDYPIKESILSILPIVDEFVIAFIPGDQDDNTLEIIESINSPKIKIIPAKWQPEKYPHNTLYSYLSDVAKNECKGKWLFYLQADEVVHEQELPGIKKACQFYLEHPNVEGLLFNYRHFWGDYEHCFTHHGWYPKEIRVLKNHSTIHSWRDAQSFRVYETFKQTADYYRSKKGTRKLNVASVPFYIYHYGWVRPPKVMATKQTGMMRTWRPEQNISALTDIDYGPLNKVPLFKGTHPGVMKARIASFNWADKLQFSGKPNPNRISYKHDKLKYRVKSWVELNILGGKEIGGFKNYSLVTTYNSQK